MKKVQLLIFFLFVNLLYSNIALSNGLWPFYFKDNETLNILSPFYESKIKNEKKVILRPFFLYNKKGNNYWYYFLYPLVEFSKDNNFTTKRIFPIFNEKYNNNKTENESFTQFFPIFWGKTDKNNKYGGIFPIYGKILNKFHYNEIKFILWPLYFSKKRFEDYDYNFLWPFFGYGTGENYSAFRFWPFFGYKKKKNYFSRKFFLWPFFIFQKRKISNFQNKWEYTNIFFPFYIHTFSDNYNYKTFLYPFFRINKRNNNYRYYAFPWPFFTIEKDRNYYDISIFPLIHAVHKKQYDRNTILWIVYRNEKLYSKNRKKLLCENSNFLLLNKFEINYEKNSKYENIWPFFEYWQKDNNYILKILEPFPFKIPVVYELYSTFFNIFYITKKDNIKKINFLWGLFSLKIDKKNTCFNFFKILNFCISKKESKNKTDFFNKETWRLICDTGM